MVLGKIIHVIVAQSGTDTDKIKDYSRRIVSVPVCICDVNATETKLLVYKQLSYIRRVSLHLREGGKRERRCSFLTRL